ncbi:MAG TPA: cadherin repeat domain-containing protein [Allosphingosinicella sp.]|nr:cadherin repeat domain-containing protein [Allosphingosinicella sp.]
MSTDALQDGAGTAIKAQRYDSLGNAAGPEILINSSAAGDQRAPSVTTLASGGYVVTWETTDATRTAAAGRSTPPPERSPSGPADFESVADFDSDNVFEVIVRASNGAASDDQHLSVTLINVDEGVTIISGGGADSLAVTLGENQTAVASVGAVDTDGGPIVYSIAGGADSALFAIDAQTGLLRFVAAPSHESPADLDGDNVYVVQVAASDGLFFDHQTISIQVGDVEEEVAITTGPALFVDEDKAFVTRVAATDGDGDTVGFAIVGGADASHFVIDPETGDLSLRASLDYEAPADSDGDNVYEVTVRASDGQFSDDRQMSIRVNDVYDDVEIVSFGGADSVALTMVEGSSFLVADLDASFSSMAGVRFAIQGGADSALFTIDPNDGRLSFNYPFMPNFEAPGDSDGDNVYDVTVVATMATSSDTQSFAITIADRNEGLWITSDGSGDANLTINEGNRIVTTVTAHDEDGDVPAYSIVGGGGRRPVRDRLGDRNPHLHRRSRL